MASVGDALAIWSNISKAASTLEDLGTNSSALSEEFRDEVGILRERLKFYDEQIRSQRGRESGTIVAILKKAQRILNKVEPRVKSVQDMQNNIDSGGCCSLICWLYAKLSLALFPEKLEGTLKKVTEEINKISNVMQQEENFVIEMDKKRRFPRTIYTTFYDNSNLYVPIQESHDKTLMAIENLDGPSIVLLHGGVGKGKSTLARYVCAHYGGQERGLFEHVIMVLCGGNRTWVDPLSKQFEILQVLSPKSLDGLSPKQEEPNAHERIERALRMFLKDNKVLIILDDVSDSDFLYEMWKVAQGCKHVKYFVTTQLGSLCDDSLERESFSIAMGDPNKNESRKILASLVGLADKIIPENLETEADQMIKATGGNPLALACLTSHFAKGHHKADKQTWREALQQLDDLLARPAQRRVLGLNHQSASLWAAVELCLKMLGSAGAKDILLFMYACKGEAIPEAVLRIWYKTTKTTKTTKTSDLFSSAIEELSARELLKSTPSTRIATMMTWSLRPLLKLYMDGHTVDEEERMRRLFGSLLRGSQVGPWSDKQNTKSWFGFSLAGNRIAPESSSVKERPGSEIEAVESDESDESDERRVAKALCAMYFDPTHSNKIVSEVMDLSVGISDLRRKAIEPIIWLLDQPEEDDIWTKAHVQCVRKVFLEYVCEYQLDDENIYLLLTTTRYTTATLAIVTTLENIFAIEEGTLLNRDHMTFLKPLLDTSGSNQENIQQDLQEAASRTIYHISRRATAEDLLIIINTFPILEVLAKFLENSSADSCANAMNKVPQILARNAAHILSNMASNGDEQINLKILNPQHHFLTSLVRALGKDDDPGFQQIAALALSNLATGEESIRNIVREDRALQGLVRALSNDNNPFFQFIAACALAGLAQGGEPTPNHIVREDGALQGLVRALSNDNNPLFQQSAAWALASLGQGGEAIQNRIVREDGALQGLVRALSNDHNPGFQQHAAGALANLATGGKSICNSIVREDGALQGLVRALSNDHNPHFQRLAAEALASLAAGGESICDSIVREDRALESLVRALSNDNNPGFQQSAAGAIANLANGGEPIRDRIARADDALRRLVRALSSDNNLFFQRNAAFALANLAQGGEPIRNRIVREDGALQGLVRALSDDNNPLFQSNGARALGNLAQGEPTCECIVKEDKALKGLVKGLSTANNPGFQYNAAWALASLAQGGEPTRNGIVREDGALQGLVRALSNDHNPGVQEYAALALGGLATGGQSICDSIVREDRALEGLVRPLSNDNNPGFQQNAALALANLATGGESIRNSIVREDGALQGLVRALSNDNNPGFQQNAAFALSNLAQGGSLFETALREKTGQSRAL